MRSFTDMTVDNDNEHSHHDSPNGNSYGRMTAEDENYHYHHDSTNTTIFTTKTVDNDSSQIEMTGNSVPANSFTSCVFSDTAQFPRNKVITNYIRGMIINQATLNTAFPYQDVDDNIVNGFIHAMCEYATQRGKKFTMYNNILKKEHIKPKE